MTVSKSSQLENPEKRLQRMLARKVIAMKVEKERLNWLEKNVKHIAKKLGVELK